MENPFVLFNRDIRVSFKFFGLKIYFNNLKLLVSIMGITILNYFITLPITRELTIIFGKLKMMRKL